MFSMKDYEKPDHIEEKFTSKDSTSSFHEGADAKSNLRYLEFNTRIQETATKRQKNKIDSLYESNLPKKNRVNIKVELGKFI